MSLFPEGLGLYVHWPYCTRICPYCDFNVFRARDEDENALLDAIIADLRDHAARMGKRQAETLFLGGGTPSLLSGQGVARLIQAARESFNLSADAEITLEANPEHHARFAELVAAGINRLSLGVQALNDDDLKKLGRAHDAAMARAAVESAAQTGARVSIDLIYAREGQTREAWAEELREALAMPAEHLSLYQLSIEEGTAFGAAVRRGALRVPDVEEAAAFFEQTQMLCEEAGMPAYEISNHARSERAQSRHNLIYWRSGEWVGVGPGAHGRVVIAGQRLATKAFDRPAAYIGSVEGRGVGWETAEALGDQERAQERVLMGLRIREGVARDNAMDADVLEALRVAGFLSVDSQRIALTAKGRLVADRVSAEVLGGD